MKVMFYSLLAVTTLIPLMAYAAKTDNPKRIKIHDKEFEVSIPYETIMQRTREIAQEIKKEYEGKKPIFLGVLNGAAVFMINLALEADIDCEFDFIKVASYGSRTTSSGIITLSKEPSCDLTDRDVIIVEDIIDTGLTIQYVRELIAKQNPRSIKIATLTHKNHGEVPFPVDYVGFNIEPLFIIGHGLDYDQVGRNLKDIYTLVE